MQEKDIKHEAGRFWVGDTNDSYVVFASGITHSVSESAYACDADGLSIAVARCDYLARRETETGRRLKI
ncbi:hypothetical protein WT27_12740 [Burkholderia territorii]|uniref:Uncharacterized protein n=1 Tax=Burkholderia territorii TaxID=1503055 RepID=A0A125BPL9_9BURK|nr:hypothetical protein [Burkholderia territorii]KVV40793.1 hypothetical protein WT27_12740 [Burkholderia territorii]KVX33740.1 hypothetical protein WT31_08640 [Burkholderia territorii]